MQITNETIGTLSPLKPVRTPWDHQWTAIKLALAQPHGFALLMEMGTGKSGTAINVLRYKFAERGHIGKTLILCPLSPMTNWKDEFNLFSRIDPKNILVLNQSTGQKKFKTFVNFVANRDTNLMSENAIIIANFECLQNKNLYEAIYSWRPQYLIVDEVHRLKNPKGVRFKKTRNIADNAWFRLILTGTPIINSIEDIFAQYRLMDRGNAFGEEFFPFRDKYFLDKNQMRAGRPGYFPDYQPRVGAAEEIKKLMYHDQRTGQQIAYRVTKDECLDLPPLVETTIAFEMNEEQSKMYKQMKKEFLTWVEEVKNQGVPIASVANQAVTRVIRLQQIVNGYIHAEDNKDYPILDNPRPKILKDLLEDYSKSGKIIVWVNFIKCYEDIRKVCSDLKLEWAECVGSTKDKSSEIERFKKDDNCRVMISHPRSGGVGINLTEAPVSIFYTRSFSLEDDLQATARNYRGGSEVHAKITRVDIVCKDSIDAVIMQALKEKKQLSQSVVDLARMVDS